MTSGSVDTPAPVSAPDEVGEDERPPPPDADEQPVGGDRPEVAGGAAPGSAAPTPLGRLLTALPSYDPSRLYTHYVPLALLAIVVLYWLRIFLPLTVGQQRNYSTFDFDLGIFDQAAWLAAHGRGFITVRGLHLLGHHLNLGLLLFAPVYWFGAGAEFLNAMMVLALAASVVPITAICRRYRPGQSWLPLAFGFTFLFNAITQDLIVESFHPEKMAIPFMFAMLWAALERRWRLFAIFAVLVIIWKEDLAFFIIMMGIGVAWKRDRRIGLITAALGIAYFFVATKLVIPHFAGGGAFYSDFMGELGASPPDMAVHAIRDPARFANKYNANDGTGYVTKLVAPWLFTPLLSPSSMLLALPAYLVNVLSSQGYTHLLDRHYVTVPFVASVFSAIRGTLARSTALIRGGLACGMVFLAIWTHQAGTGPWSTRYESGIWGTVHTAHHEVLDEALAGVPGDASVAASYFIVPHLTGRAEVYAFPNPWMPSNWGILDKDPRDPETVDWIVVDEGSIAAPRIQTVLANLKASPCFAQSFNRDNVLVLHRTGHGPQCRVAIPPPT